MDDMIDKIARAFQSGSEREKFEYIKVYYEEYLPAKATKMWAEFGVQFGLFFAETVLWL
jgi:hypothetical protein